MFVLNQNLEKRLSFIYEHKFRSPKMLQIVVWVVAFI